ncbi:MAG TPA: 50S ribosomal protein L25/general stress protein Ctc [Steroidobacteraceae bacterium]|nr:50S ribosomal protein L25/general stress protein Ctc [Steroidobacteraceae bacterium]
MRISFVIGADFRDTQGKGASRRLRVKGKVPAILYGGGQNPRALILDQQNLLTMIDNEKFYSSIVQLKVANETQEAIVKDVQMHPAKNLVVHLDLQRVLENEKLRIRLPIHFRNASVSPGVKTQGGIVSHLMNDVEVVCLPKDLPEFLEVDMANMNLNDIKYLADIPVPEGVQLPALGQGRNPAVVSIHSPRAEEPEAVAAEAAPAEGAAAAAAPAGAGAAAPAADAKKDDKAAAAAPAKKDAGKK